MKKIPALLLALMTLFAVCPRAHAQATLTQTIDLSAWTGTPVTVVQPPPPKPAAGFSLTGIAFDPVSHTIYVSDYATTNVYLIDSATKAVSSAVYMNGLFTTADIGATQDVPGQAPTVVLANPSTNRWMFTGEGGGAEFNGTAFAEPLTPRAMQSGAAWDPATDNIYAADGLRWFATNNAKFLFAGGGACNAVTFSTATSRVYVSCNGGLGVYDGITLSQASVKIPTAPLAVVPVGAQPNGIAFNANTNRIYVAGATNRTSLDVFDASTYQTLASVAGLPDQSGDVLVAGYLGLPLPRPIAVNMRTNTIFVVNSVSSTISVFDGATNTLSGTITVPVPDGAVVSQALPPATQLSEIKPGNTFYNSSTGMLTTLGGAIALAVNEADNELYVANSNGTVSVFQLDPPVVSPTFSVNGTIKDAAGVPASGVTVTAQGTLGNATAMTDATGLFVLTGLAAGSYSVVPQSASFSFAPGPQTVTVTDANLRGLSFTALPPVVPVSYSLSPWTTIGAGVVTSATVTLNQPAPAGGASVTLSVSDPKAAKFPSKVTVATGQVAAVFQVQGNGVSAPTTVTLTASYNGGSASTALTVAPGDSLKVSSATYSKSQQLLQVKATSTNPAAILQLQNANNNLILGTMTNFGNGSFSFQQNLVTGVPTSVNIISNLGGKTGQGVAVIQ
jgi:DNA-binding beta-propeller fold protein YncE